VHHISREGGGTELGVVIAVRAVAARVLITTAVGVGLRACQAVAQFTDAMLDTAKLVADVGGCLHESRLLGVGYRGDPGHLGAAGHVPDASVESPACRAQFTHDNRRGDQGHVPGRLAVAWG
jgi:hypothetical protein